MSSGQLFTRGMCCLSICKTLVDKWEKGASVLEELLFFFFFSDITEGMNKQGISRKQQATDDSFKSVCLVLLWPGEVYSNKMQVLYICLKVTDCMQRWFNPFSPCNIQGYSAVTCQKAAGVWQKYGVFSTWTTSSWRWGGRSTGWICICFFKKHYALGIYICKEERRFSFLYSFDPSLGFNLSYLISKHLCGLCDMLICQAEGLVFLLQNLPESSCSGQQQLSESPLDAPVIMPGVEVFLTAVAHSVMLNGHRNMMVKTENYKLKESQSWRRKEFSC